MRINSVVKNKIVFITWRSSIGGIEVQIPYMIKQSPFQEAHLYVMRPTDRIDSDIFSDPASIIHYGSKSSIFLFFKLLFFVFRNRNALFMGFNLGPFILFILRLGCAKKLIYSIHGTIYWRNTFQKILRKFFWWISLSPSITFIANSEYSKKVFLSSVSSKPDIKVIYNIFDTEKLHPTNKIHDFDKLDICYVGRLAKGKNLPLWINIASEILKVYPGFRFHIYGDGPLFNELQLLIKNRNHENAIFLHGITSDLANIYQSNDLLLFLSEYESFGNVVVESILCGTPVIASKIPSMEEIFRGYPEFLVEIDNCLVNNIIEKLQNYSSLKSTALKLSTEFGHVFSPQAYNEKLTEVFSDAY